MAMAAGNRMAGAAIATAGAWLGNAALVRAGTQSMTTGRNAVSGAAASQLDAAGQKRSAKMSESRAQKGDSGGDKGQSKGQGTAQASYANGPDPRSAGSAGQGAGQKDGGAKSDYPAGGQQTTPSRGGATVTQEAKTTPNRSLPPGKS